MPMPMKSPVLATCRERARDSARARQPGLLRARHGERGRCLVGAGLRHGQPYPGIAQQQAAAEQPFWRVLSVIPYADKGTALRTAQQSEQFDLAIADEWRLQGEAVYALLGGKIDQRDEIRSCVG
ncbi:hypothetical protein ACFSUK_07525 [Sphingobium scionense]